MTSLSMMRAMSQSGRDEQRAARRAVDGREPRTVNLESLRVSEPESNEDRRERMMRGRVAEMTERQAGL